MYSQLKKNIWVLRNKQKHLNGTFTSPFSRLKFTPDYLLLCDGELRSVHNASSLPLLSHFPLLQHWLSHGMQSCSKKSSASARVLQGFPFLQEILICSGVAPPQFAVDTCLVEHHEPPPPLTLVFPLLFSTIFVSHLFCLSITFCPLKCIFTEMTLALLMGSAVSCGGHTTELVGTRWNHLCPAWGNP